MRRRLRQHHLLAEEAGPRLQHLADLAAPPCERDKAFVGDSALDHEGDRLAGRIRRCAHRDCPLQLFLQRRPPISQVSSTQRSSPTIMTANSMLAAWSIVRGPPPSAISDSCQGCAACRRSDRARRIGLLAGLEIAELVVDREAFGPPRVIDQNPRRARACCARPRQFFPRRSMLPSSSVLIAHADLVGVVEHRVHREAFAAADVAADDIFTRCFGSVARPRRNRPLPRNRFEHGQNTTAAPFFDMRRNSLFER